MKIKETWDLQKLFSSPTDPAIQKEAAEIDVRVNNFVAKWKDDSSYATDKSSLLQALTEYEELITKGGVGGEQSYYAGLLSALDQLSPEIKAFGNKIEDESKKRAIALQFFELTLGKASKDFQKEVLADAQFAPYTYYLSRIFDTAKYDLSEKEERIITELWSAANGKWRELTSQELSRKTAAIVVNNQKKKATIGELLELSKNWDKKLRDEAGKKAAKLIRSLKYIAEAEMNAILESRKAMRDLRGAERVDIFRLIADDVSPGMVDALRKAVSSRNDIAREYYELKAKLLKQEKLEYYERGVEFPVQTDTYSFEQATALVSETFRGLDAEFGNIFDEFAGSGAMDAYPKKGKMSGAFCAHHLVTSPVYILLNFTGTLNDVRTIAHEAGHGVHDELMRDVKTGLYYHTSLATAEVASTFMEDFVTDKLFAQANEETRLHLLMNSLNDDIATIFRQIACYNFEWDLHTQFAKKKYLSEKDIAKLFKKHMKAYMGPSVSQRVGGNDFWVYWSHIRSSFYVYSYASGLLISKALQFMVRNDKKSIQSVKEVLKKGASASPAELFKSVGIDIQDKSFWEKGLLTIEEKLAEAKSLAKKLGKI
ncbi:MAG: M3 family oligoendopeptidase [Candidatus Dojkabacteria bacterium]|nr:MAG: M3 family oligoendopeptidase [Candidatus Dojkabacteria bacterium]